MKLSQQARRRLFHGSNATLVTLLVLVLVGLVLGVADRHRVRIDLSEEGASRLQPDTLKKLALLDAEGQEVRITAFTPQQGRPDAWFKKRAMRDLLEELDHHSRVLTWRMVDFDRDRLTAESLGVTLHGTVVVQRGEDRVDIRERELFRRAREKGQPPEFYGESVLNRAFSQLLGKRERRIYSLRGHGEHDPEEAGPDGLSGLVELLETESYRLEPLDLLRGRESDEPPIVPPDASALLVAGPKVALTGPEQDALISYAARGGSILLALDPGAPVPLLVERLGLRVAEGLAMDRVLIYPYRDRPVVRLRPHGVTRDLIDERLVPVLAHIAPLELLPDAPPWVRAVPILQTSRTGWIERGGRLEEGRAVFDPGIDVEGPAVMAMAVEVQPDEQGLVRPGRRVARILVSGDSDFLTNALLEEGPGNATLAVNAFRWLVWDDARLSVVGRPTTLRRLALTRRDQDVIRWIVLGLMPSVTVLAGVLVWLGRRGR